MTDIFDNVPYTIYDPMPPEEEKATFIKLQDLPDGTKRDALVDKIIRCNTRFVISEVDKIIKSKLFKVSIADKHDLRDDMIGLGLIGLMSSIEGFDPHHGVRFLTYARWNIHSKIVQSLVDSYTIKVNRDEDVKYVLFDEENAGLTEKLLETEIPFPDPMWTYAKEEELELLLEEIEKLGPREAYVLLTHFGFDCNPTSMKVIGDDLGMGREWVRQVRDNALDNLRANRTVSDINKGE